MRKRWVTAILIAVPSAALANAAMGLGIEIFDLNYWGAYVIATVVLEAWMIGRWLKKSWAASMGISCIANFVTAFTCWSICPVFFHWTLVGSSVDPNPFVNSILLLLICGAISALCEMFVWHISTGRKNIEGRLIGRTFLAHLAGIPLALMILLIPEHPYRGTERLTAMYRRWRLPYALKTRLLSLIDNPIPRAKSLPELWTQLPSSGRPDEDILIYYPSFKRFATCDSRDIPIGEWNTSLGGKPPTYLYEHAPIWLVRRQRRDGSVDGWYFDHEGHVTATSDPSLLGWSTSGAQR